jgi:hypothetical protein
VTQTARILVSLGVGWLVSLFARESLTPVQTLLAFAVAAGVTWGLTMPLARPEAEREAASPSVRGLGIASAVSLAAGVVLVFAGQPLAGIVAAIVGLVLAGVWALLSWHAGRGTAPRA